MASVSLSASGIDYSDYQTPTSAGSMASELLDHYEEHSQITFFVPNDEKEFTFLVDFPITFHLNTPLMETFYHLTISNILVTSNSSLSWTAHLFGNNKRVYARANFFHSWYLGTILISKSGRPKNKLTSFVLIQYYRIKAIFKYFYIKKLRPIWN